MPGLTKGLSALILFVAVFLAAAPGCGEKSGRSPELEVPRGYLSVLWIEQEGRRLGFGPFKGYYFKPEGSEDFSKVDFICFNEDRFYTLDLPENTKLFRGTAVLSELSGSVMALPDENRINPVFFQDAPTQWLENRPEPMDEFVHFHSCYDAEGPVLTGYWLRHEGVAEFTYDMGGRVEPDSPLYHDVRRATDTDFARIIEFDRGPGTAEMP